MKIARLLITFCAFVTIWSHSLAQTDTANVKESHIRSLLDLMGTPKIAMQIMKQMIDTYKEKVPNVPSDFWDEFSKQVNPEDLENLVVPIYAKYFSDSDILQLLEFYNSPIGQKFIKNLPSISQDAYQAGQSWGEKIGKQVVDKLKIKGYIKNG